MLLGIADLDAFLSETENNDAVDSSMLRPDKAPETRPGVNKQFRQEQRATVPKLVTPDVTINILGSLLLLVRDDDDRKQRRYKVFPINKRTDQHHKQHSRSHRRNFQKLIGTD